MAAPRLVGLPRLLGENGYACAVSLFVLWLNGGGGGGCAATAAAASAALAFAVAGSCIPVAPRICSDSAVALP